MAAILCCVAAMGRAWCGIDEEKIWKVYVEWYRRQPVSVSDPRGTYLNHLRGAGIGETGIRQRSEVIERLARERRGELHPIFFDRTYSSPPRFNTEPNALLMETVRDLKPGRALDVHMGQGRNFSAGTRTSSSAARNGAWW